MLRNGKKLGFKKALTAAVLDRLEKIAEERRRRNAEKLMQDIFPPQVLGASPLLCKAFDKEKVS